MKTKPGEITSDARLWTHVRVLYACTCVLTCLLVTVTWLGHREVTRLRSDIEGQLMSRRVVEFNDDVVNDIPGDFSEARDAFGDFPVEEDVDMTKTEDEVSRVKRGARRNRHGRESSARDSDALGGRGKQHVLSEGSGAMDDWAWVTSYSRIPVSTPYNSRNQPCLSQKTRNVDPISDQCWASVADAGPTLIQYWVSVSYLLGSFTRIPYLLYRVLPEAKCHICHLG